MREAQGAKRGAENPSLGEAPFGWKKTASRQRLFSFVRRTPPLARGFQPLALVCLLALPGCTPRPARVSPAASAETPTAGAATETLAPGVIHRAIPVGDGGVDVIEVDLTRSRAKLTVQTEGILRAGGGVVGQARTPHEWLTRTGALAAVNGGYFGPYEDSAGRKDFVGLLVQKGRVRHAAPPLHGAGSAAIKRGQYVRSAFGLLADGTPSIVWAATDSGSPQSLHAYAAPMGGRGAVWPVWDAVGCGPTLISAGRVSVTQSSERLASPGARPRTFVAYDGPPGHPRHFVFGIASGMTFPALAAFLRDYFPRCTQSAAQAAMCLDGGASTQLSYRLNGEVQSPMETGMTVPDALVLLPGEHKDEGLKTPR